MSYWKAPQYAHVSANTSGLKVFFTKKRPWIHMETENTTSFPEVCMVGTKKWWKVKWLFKSAYLFTCTPAELRFKALQLPHCFSEYATSDKTDANTDIQKRNWRAGATAEVSVIYPQWNLQTVMTPTPVAEHFSFI